MYLRANYAYYLHTLVPCLIEQSSIILSVYISLSDFQNLRDAKEIYNAIIVKIIEEIIAVCNHLQSADEMRRLHIGASSLSGTWSTDEGLCKVILNLKKLTSGEYVEKIRRSSEKKEVLHTNF